MHGCNHLNKTLIACTLAAGLVPAGAMAVTSATADVGPLLDLASYSSIDTSVSPVIARGSGGNFVLAWQPHVADNGDHGPAQVQSFAANGTPLGAPISIGTHVSGNAAVAVDRDGDFVVGWTEGFSYGFEQLHVQRYSANGTTQGARKSLDTVYNGISGVLYKTFFSKSSSPLQVAMDDDGDFVAAWTQSNTVEIIENFYNIFTSTSSKTYAVAYRASGTLLKGKKVVDQFEAAEKYPNADQLAAVAMNGKGDFALVYNSNRGGENQPPIAQFYGIDLKPLGTSVNMPAVSAARIGASMIGLDATDKLVVGWNQNLEPE